MTADAGSAGQASSWDCHAHVFGPYAKYPLAGERSYSPPEATEQAYAALLARLGFGHGVLVHPSAYGENYTLLLDTLARRPQWRGVLVARANQSLSLNGLREKGIRALRFSARSGAGANFAGSALFTDFEQLATRMAEAGLHAEVWTDCAALLALESAIAASPVPVMLDHMAGFDARAGIAQDGFQCLLRLMQSGKVWVKLCAYRNVPGFVDLDAARPFHDALLSVNPERLVWGSDWPHLRVVPEPDTVGLLQTFRSWTSHACAHGAMAERILVINPRQLYD